MKSLTKRISVYTLIAALIVAIIAGTGLVFKGVAVANAVDNYSNSYFYNQIKIDSRAEKFYKAFETLEYGNLEDNSFRNGKVEYDLVANEVLSADDVAEYVNNGDGKVPVAYGMGRDAYFMDHPDLFYIDVFSTSISAGQQGQDYVSFLDTSRATTLYLGNLDSRAKVNDAIQAYENKLSEIVNLAKASNDVVEQIKTVNKYIINNTAYGYGTQVINGKNVDTDAAPYVHTSYGALVNGEAVCEGYSKAFKAVMDRLNIPCVCVIGYSVASDKSTYQPHMWNYVKVEGMWYAVDVTWNDTENSSEKWLLMGEKSFSVRHLEDGIVSSSNIEFKYPALKPYNYGIDTDDNGMSIDGAYRETDGGRILDLTVSYEGKGAAKLKEEGKYLVMRFGETQEDGEIFWAEWVDCILGGEEMFGMISYDAEHTYAHLNENMEYIQFALLDYAPDGPLAEPPYFSYNKDRVTEEHFLSEISAPYKNDGYIEYFPAPAAISFTPSNTGDLPVNKTYDITVSYTDPLKLMEGKTAEDVTMEFYLASGDESIKRYATVSDVVWSSDTPETISFKFTPSLMYEHNTVAYYFYPTNLVGGRGNKVPSPFTYSFRSKQVICSRVFNDGRLYMQVYGEPKILDTSDLSVTDFKDENGNYYASSQRSQLMLVASKPSEEKEQKMDEVLKSGTQIKDDDILTSASYEIDLQVCGIVQKVPNGSYMQVSFGFPEGYRPDDVDGTTFKIYHYKHDDAGNITGVEEIPVIVTKYGIIARVKSFSPFTIVQLKNTSDEVQNTDSKNIYATVVGNGGSISTQKEIGKSGIDEVTGDSITYDITADDGFRLAKAFLNGNAIDDSRIVNGKLTLTKAELESSNTLEVTFITKESAESFEARGINIAHVLVEVDELPVLSAEPDILPESSAPKSNAGLIAGCVIAGLVVIAGVAVLTVFLLKKKKNNGAKA